MMKHSMFSDFGFDEQMLEKRERLRQFTDPYPYSFDSVEQIESIVCAFESKELKPKTAVRIAGRIWAMRNMGKSKFVDLKDESGKVHPQDKKACDQKSSL